MRNTSALLVLIALSLSCGKSSATNGGMIVDFTKFDLIQFKSAAGIGVSGDRYDLTLASKSLKQYHYSSTAGSYVLEQDLTMTEAAKGDLSQKLRKITVKSLGACAEAVCSAARASIWMELPNIAPPQYYFSKQGDCSCPDDGENAPTLSYSQMDTIYQTILGLLGT